jgi:hypothetical protein
MNFLKINYCIEDLLSRNCGLFAYLEYDENGVPEIHQATDSNEGCYGKIVVALTIPQGNGLHMADIHINENETYNYTTLIDYYYQLHKLHPNEPFIKFMERGIGKFSTKSSLCDFKKCDLVPEWVFYSECGDLVDEYTKLKIVTTNYKNSGMCNVELECLVDKYERMGGDIMLEYYKSKYKEGKAIAKEYLEYAKDNIDKTIYNISLNITNEYKDLGLVTLYYDEWDKNQTYNEGDYVVYNDVSYVCLENGVNSVWDMQTQSKTIDLSEKNFKKIKDNTLVNDDVTLEGISNSKIDGFKMGKVYINLEGLIDQPADGTDWLYYYKIGNIAYYETETDRLNNIVIKDGCSRNTTIGEKETDLLAYGDVLTDISYNKDKYTITFKYVIGAHLLATLVGSETDDDGNTLYFYKNYEVDTKDIYHGVYYEETFRYEIGSEIECLINNGLFDKYVSGTLTKEEETVIPDGYDISYKYFKCGFKRIGVPTTIIPVNNVQKLAFIPISNFQVTLNKERDILEQPIVKEDYLMGLMYHPIIETDVNIIRGNNCAWERHMKLGEVKTFDNLLEYANGGFFNVINL